MLTVASSKLATCCGIVVWNFTCTRHFRSVASHMQEVCVGATACLSCWLPLLPCSFEWPSAAPVVTAGGNLSGCCGENAEWWSLQNYCLLHWHKGTQRKPSPACSAAGHCSCAACGGQAWMAHGHAGAFCCRTHVLVPLFCHDRLAISPQSL
jgi:hypothetical protein